MKDLNVKALIAGLLFGTGIAMSFQTDAARLTLKWDPVIDERVTHYSLCRGRESGKCDVNVNTGPRTTYTMCFLRLDTIYYFTVRAKSATETSGPSNEVFSKPKPMTTSACSKPTP